MTKLTSLSLTILLFASFLIVSCGDAASDGQSDNNNEMQSMADEANSPFVGTWSFESVSYNKSELKAEDGDSSMEIQQLDQMVTMTNQQAKGTNYAFKPDGTLTISAQGVSQNTSYEILQDGAALSFKANANEPSVDWEVVSIDESNMTLRLNQEVPIGTGGELFTLKMDFLYARQN